MVSAFLDHKRLCVKKLAMNRRDNNKKKRWRLCLLYKYKYESLLFSFLTWTKKKSGCILFKCHVTVSLFNIIFIFFIFCTNNCKIEHFSDRYVLIESWYRRVLGVVNAAFYNCHLYSFYFCCCYVWFSYGSLIVNKQINYV